MSGSLSIANNYLALFLYSPRDLKSFSHILSVINADPSATFIPFSA
nr:MAG TPA: hypothetical protein [Crassvirales sp.]